jgi:hypothetical protein
MACSKYLNSIQELVDGTIGSIRRAELEMHLDECEDCRALREDLQRIHDAAASLPPLEAPDRAWLQIAGRLRQEGRISDAAVPSKAGSRSAVWLAAAAAVILAVITGALVLMSRAEPARQTAQTTPSATAPATPAPAAVDQKTVESATSAVDAAQEQFEKAIENLEKVAKANQNALDPATSETIDKNLGIIDQAIAENRAAVSAEPASVAARETLFQALRSKVALLQDTITLINEMRKGNNAAAAQLVNKS